MKPWQVPTAWRGLERWLESVLPLELRESAQMVVEIGTDWGYSFWELRILFPKATVLSVDPYGDKAEAWAGKDGAEAKRFVESWASKDPRAQMCSATSVEAAAGWKGLPIDFLHLDGKHDMASVTADFNAWLPHVREGGLIAFHDTVSHARTVGHFVDKLKSLLDGEVIHETDAYYGMAIWKKGARNDA